MTKHTDNCDWHVDQYPWECTCGAIPRKAAMDKLIAQDADMTTIPLPHWRYRMGDRVTKTKGSSWTGRVVGFYSTSLTPEGYAVESENEPGSVQIYPVGALADAP